FFEGLRDLGQDCAAGSRDHDVIRQFPSQLFRDFEAKGLRALGVVRSQVDIDERPSILVRDFAAEAIHVVVVATNNDHLRAIDGRADNFSGLHPLRHENEAFEPGARRMGSDRGGEIAGRGARHGREAKFARLGYRDRYHPVFVRKGGMIDGIILDVQALQPELGAQAPAVNQRCESGVRSDFGLAVDGQQFAIAPEVVWTRLDLRAGQGGANFRVVVVDLQGPETRLTDMERGNRVVLSTFFALEIRDVAHRVLY